MLQSPKKFQEILKRTAAPVRKQPRVSPAAARSPMEVLVRKIHLDVQMGVAAIALALIAGWGSSLTFATRATSVDTRSTALVGSYTVNGAGADGVPYNAAPSLDVLSSEVELDWNSGKQVGVGQVVDGAVARTGKGRTAILFITVNPDGSLTGGGTHRGHLGNEMWTLSAD
jgi:hypothetical protein